MELNPRVKHQVVCKVIKSVPLDKIIVIEIDGEKHSAKKVIGFSFLQGEYALLKTFKGSDESLVVAMNNAEKDYYYNDILTIKKKRQVEQNNSRLSTRIIPLDTDFTDEIISEKIKFLFQPNLSAGAFNEVLTEVFSIVAVQENSNYKPLKEKIFEKADTAINRNIILNKSFREAHVFMENMVERIATKADHLQFFRAVNFFLKRLNKRLNAGKIDAEKISAIFEPIYKIYVDKYGSNFLDIWVNKINEEK
ncbi:MAG: hypothetical protein COA79_18990 [Planctomycetota bacterium]|nr:MAG: hypothetical protein COA79_18990 [Planctomycetota bacterium]